MTWTNPHSSGGRWWTEDVALELWVDSERDPVVIRLEGTLDASTATNLLAVVHELIEEEGACDFELRASALTVVQPDGALALDDLEGMIRRCGGKLTGALRPAGSAAGRRGTQHARAAGLAPVQYAAPCQPAFRCQRDRRCETSAGVSSDDSMVGTVHAEQRSSPSTRRVTPTMPQR